MTSAPFAVAIALLFAGPAPAPASGSGLGPLAAGAGQSPARLLVTAREWRLTLSRQRLRRGPALIQLANLGEDDHDLALRRLRSRRTTRMAVTRPGEVSEVETSLRAGTYRLWCALPRHARLGMRATLRVR